MFIYTAGNKYFRGIIVFKEAIKRPFSSPVRLVWAVVLLVLPIVNFIFFGYLYECIRSSQKNDMPEFKRYGSLFMTGFKMFIISLLYTLPVYILLSIAMTFYLAVDDLLGFPIYAICVIAAYLLPLALVNFAINDSVAFAFQGLLKKAFTKLYLKTIVQLLLLVIPYLLVSSAVAYVLFTFLVDIDWIFYPVSLFTVYFFSALYQITSMTILARVYGKL